MAIPFKQAWTIQERDWEDIAKKYNLEIKIYAIESGTGFYCMFHVLSDGAILDRAFYQTEQYENFIWDCPFPWMGG